MFSAFNPSKCTHLEQWAADTAVPGEQLGVRCLAQGSHLSRGHFLPEFNKPVPQCQGCGISSLYLPFTSEVFSTTLHLPNDL